MPQLFQLLLIALIPFIGPITSGLAAQQARPGGAMTIVQLQYDGGGDWYANPSALPNLLSFIRERTNLPVETRPVTLKLTDPAIWNYPYLYMTGHGNVRFTDEEVEILRRYLTSGGFLHADDNYGLDESFRREMRRVFPDQELVELPADHPIYHVFYDFPKGLPKIHEHDGKPAQGFGLFHNGRLVVYYTYETDLGDGWEDEQVHGNPPQVREQALRMGLNVFLYALSQVVP
ncbi:MAG TPA: DUF4159 domain-containing protein [Longimicrobiales bacterium]|nr:DUF4159 domain-containing protein [Longimicrobiales bacterium]